MENVVILVLCQQVMHDRHCRRREKIVSNPLRLYCSCTSLLYLARCCSDTLCAHGFLFCICFILSFRSGLRAVFLEMYVIAGFAEVT